MGSTSPEKVVNVVAGMYLREQQQDALVDAVRSQGRLLRPAGDAGSRKTFSERTFQDWFHSAISNALSSTIQEATPSRPRKVD
jgi:hypothetical protein